MNYEIVISDKARHMLGAHMRFLAEVSEDSAQKLTGELLSAIRSLDHMPHRYPYFNERYIPANKYRKMYVTKHYLILYQIRDNTVYVDYIVDCRQGYHWLIETR